MSRKRRKKHTKAKAGRAINPLQPQQFGRYLTLKTFVGIAAIISAIATVYLLKPTAVDATASVRSADIAEQALQIQIRPRIESTLSPLISATTWTISNVGAVELELKKPITFYTMRGKGESGWTSHQIWFHQSRLKPGESREYPLSDFYGRIDPRPRPKGSLQYDVILISTEFERIVDRKPFFVIQPLLYQQGTFTGVYTRDDVSNVCAALQYIAKQPCFDSTIEPCNDYAKQLLACR